MPKRSERAEVLVVGGGLVGLSTALFLQWHGVPFILVEQRAEPSPLPRARGWAARSMELFRQLGLQEKIEDAARRAWEQGLFGGARRGATMLEAEELVIPDRSVMTGDDPSPCRMVACPQTAIEPILRRALEERGGDVRFGHAVLGFEQRAGAVVARVATADGDEGIVEAGFLAAADGSRARRSASAGTAAAARGTISTCSSRRTWPRRCAAAPSASARSRTMRSGASSCR